MTSEVSDDDSPFRYRALTSSLPFVATVDFRRVRFKNVPATDDAQGDGDSRFPPEPEDDGFVGDG